MAGPYFWDGCLAAASLIVLLLIGFIGFAIVTDRGDTDRNA